MFFGRSRNLQAPLECSLFRRVFDDRSVGGFIESLEQHDWAGVYNGVGINSKVDLLMQSMQELLNLTVPGKWVSCKPNSGGIADWVSAELQETKDHLLSLSDLRKVCNDDEVDKSFRRCRKEYRKALSKAKSDAYCEKLAKSENRTREIWGAYQWSSKWGARGSETSSLVREDGQNITNPTVVAETLSPTFKFSSDRQWYIPCRRPMSHQRWCLHLSTYPRSGIF